MQNAIRGKLVFLALIAFALTSRASNYLYIVDTSKSMIGFKAKVIEAVTKDIDRALNHETPLYKGGDHIYLWSFDSKVTELQRFEVEAELKSNLSIPIQSELDLLKMEGSTKIAEPLRKALETFSSPETGVLNLFLYTDGDSSISDRDFEKLRTLYERNYKPDHRLLNFFVIHFGKGSLRKGTQKVFDALGAKVIVAGETPDISPGNLIRTNGTPEQPVQLPPPVVIVTPAAIEFSAEAASEIVQPVSLDFKLTPPGTNLLVHLELESTNLTGGGILTVTPDQVPAAGRQTLSFHIKNAQPGKYAARLKLSSTQESKIEPAELPVAIELAASKPGTIEVHFLPEKPSLTRIPADNQWHSIPGVTMALTYPERFGNAKIRFEGKIPAGVEFQAVGASGIAKPLSANDAVRLSTLGKAVSFRLRQTSAESANKDLSTTIAVKLAAGQNAVLQGGEEVSIPFRLVVPLEVRLETREIDFGEISRGVRSLKKSLSLKVAGRPDGQKLRIASVSPGLSGISIKPAEFELTEGLTNVDLEFNGLGERQPGSFDGTILLAAVGSTNEIAFQESPVTVRGNIATPTSLVAEVESPLVAGQPFVIRAHFESGEKGSMTATVRAPDATRDQEITLADTGMADDGDLKANDGIYSASFKNTTVLGKYQITVTGKGTRSGTQQKTLAPAVYFQGPATPLAGNISVQHRDEYLKLEPRILSEYPDEVSFQVENGSGGVPLNAYLSDKTSVLKKGSTPVKLLVELLPGAKAGHYRSELLLVTSSVNGTKAKIPVSIDVTVGSLMEYFVRLIAITLVLALGVFLAIVKPWEKPKPKTVSDNTVNDPTASAYQRPFGRDRDR